MLGGICIKIDEKKLTVIVAAASQFIIQLIANMTIVSLPMLSTDLGFSAETIMWVNLIYFCSLVATCIPFAKIISQYGIMKSTRISLWGLLISVIISVCAFNSYMLLISRLIQGLTSASLSISLYMMIVEDLKEKELGSALGVVGSAGFVGVLIAPSFMGLMVYLINWRFAFLILVPILCILLYLIHNVKKEWQTEKVRIDNMGSLFYVVTMILFTYGITVLDERFIYFIASLILFAVFIRWEKKAENPIYNLGLLKNIKYLIGNYAAMVLSFCSTIAITALSFHLKYILNTDEYMIGLILMVAPIIMISMSNIAGMLTNRFDPRTLSGIATSILFCSMLLFAFMDGLPFYMILLACALQGTGVGLFVAPNNKYVLTLVDKKDLADATSFLSTSKEFGKILCTGIYSLILSLFIGNQTLGPDHLDGLLIQSTNYMMNICVLLTLSSALLLFYSRFRYGYNGNNEVIDFFKSLTPDWIKS